jgi:glycosyltransferase involved in cell wall biosynthesis
MRILHLGKYYAPERGGIESYTQALCEWTAAHGHAVAALVHQRPGLWQTTREAVNGIDVRRVACIAAPVYTPVSPTYPIELSRVLGDFAPDILHLHLPNPSCFALLASGRARRVPWVVHWHSDIPAEAPDWRLRAGYRIYKPFEQALLKRVAAIAATSDAYLDASTALAPWRAKTRVIALGAEDAALAPPRGDLWPDGAGVRWLAVGRLSHYKGFDVLIRALADVSDAQLAIVGEGECATALRKTASACGVADRVRFLGSVDDATLLAAYATADAFALPSLNRGEAFGLVLLEAMRARLPIVASAIPGSGIGEVVADGETGVLVPPGDAAALAAALARLRDANLRRRMGAQGRRRFEARFTLERSAQRWLALYEDVLR